VTKYKIPKRGQNCKKIAKSGHTDRAADITLPVLRNDSHSSANTPVREKKKIIILRDFGQT